MSEAPEALDEADLAFLLQTGAVVEEASGLHALHALNRQISGQYVDLLAGFAATAFRGEASVAMAHQVMAGIAALQRLACTSDDEPLQRSLAALEDLVPSARTRGGRARQQFMRDMKAWVLSFSSLLSDADAERMRALVSYEREGDPMVSALSGIRGIGPRRLERLYCAGLFAVDTLAHADPEEVSAVTGLSLRLARDVVETGASVRGELRQARVAEVLRLAAAVRRHVESLGAVLDDPDAEQMRLAIGDLRRVLTEMPDLEAS